MEFGPYLGGLYWKYDEQITTVPRKVIITDEPIPIETQSGWICPRCGSVNAPWVPQCNCTAVPITSNMSVDCSFKKPIEETCENCKGSNDLCYYCKNGDHWEYKGWEE